MSFRFCHVCNGDTLSGAIVDRGGAIEACSTCGTPYPKSAPAPSSGVQLAAQPIELFEDDEHERVRATVPAKATEAQGIAIQYSLPGLPAPEPKMKVTTVEITAKTSPRDALKDIRARRRAIKPEIKRLRDLEQEDRELAAAEHAIEASRRAEVTPIRSTK